MAIAAANTAAAAKNASGHAEHGVSVAEVEKAFGELNREEGGSERPSSSKATGAAQKGGHHSHGGRNPL